MRGGSIHLFKLWGIDVFLHFSWFFVAAYQLSARRYQYASPMFALYEYIALFAIVLVHEFGHALACRSTGGEANRIMLWPLGGVAFVRPPPRPGAELWSIAAGPLVNVVLIPLLILVQLLAVGLGWPENAPDAYRLVVTVSWINGGILLFNLLPIYPLDGGQILRALLWFPFGRIRSLQVASAIGFVGCLAAGAYALWLRSFWIGLLAFFLISQALAGWRQAQALALADAETRRMAEAPERPPMV
ncbi:MAG TPA: M50 family metallopeptidase [Chthoniobacterales bacterium]|nr:M50 family metallopeptidase [Chthoniobacterales bacterium]